jgi:hypothetical protein
VKQENWIFDIDGVFADWCNETRYLIEDLFGIKVPANEFPKWDWMDDHLHKDQIIQLLDYQLTHPKWWGDINPYNDARLGLETLSDVECAQQADIYFLTKREGVGVKFATERWLERLGFPGATVILTNKDKGPIIRELEASVFVDDKTSNCESAKAASPQTDVFLIDRPWNYGLPLTGKIDRYESVVDVLRLIAPEALRAQFVGDHDD